jgi:hypothetical protein
MSYRIIEVVINLEFLDRLEKFKERTEIIRYWSTEVSDESMKFSFLVDAKNTEMIIDGIVRVLDFKRILDDDENLKNIIMIREVEGFLPIVINSNTHTVHEKMTIDRVTISEIYENIKEGIYVNQNFLFGMLCSALVCCIGLVKNDPLISFTATSISTALAPVIGYSFSLATADTDSMISALRTMCIGFLTSLLTSMVAGVIFNAGHNSFYIDAILATFSQIKYSSYTFVLAFASGFAASLAITSGLSTMMAAFMMSVSIVPVLCIAGIALVNGLYNVSIESILILLTNLVCMLFSSHLVFRLKKIYPKTREAMEK